MWNELDWKKSVIIGWNSMKNMKYWTCWDSKNIRMLWNLLVFLDDMKSGQCWHEWKRICHEPTVFFDLYETMVSVLNHEMKPLSIFLRMKPGRSILTAAQVTVVSSLSTQSKQNWAPKSSQWFFCWRCPFLHENLLPASLTCPRKKNKYFFWAMFMKLPKWSCCSM